MTQEAVGEECSRYYREAQSWAQDRDLAEQKLRRVAWSVAIIATVVAVVEAIAIAMLVPLKTTVPYTLLVDRQTGYVEALKPLERQTIAPDRALVRSFLAQYVIARESFDIDSLKEDYRKVALWSSGEARDRYVAAMQASNPASPLVTLPRRALVQVPIRSVSSLNDSTALVRFSTFRADAGPQAQTSRVWAAVITYRFTGAEMSEEDRLLNPLGFQVVRYRRDAETVPEAVMTLQPAPAGNSMPAGMSGAGTSDVLSTGATP